MTLEGRRRWAMLASLSAPVAVALLVLANLIPMIGVLYFGWDVATVLFTYWLENGIVGLLNVPKILLASGPSQPLATVGADGFAGRAVMAGFFLMHYGLFWVVHGAFVVVLTGGPLAFGPTDPIRQVLSGRGLMLAAAALLVSHGASFVLNYVGRGEFRTASLGSQMFAPYPRMFVLHVAIVLGGALLIGAREPAFLVALLVVLKTVVDIGLHLREHARSARPATMV